MCSVLFSIKLFWGTWQSQYETCKLVIGCDWVTSSSVLEVKAEWACVQFEWVSVLQKKNVFWKYKEYPDETKKIHGPPVCPKVLLLSLFDAERLFSWIS